MSQLGVILQESLQREREGRTILGLLTEQMEEVDRGGTRRRRSLKERLGFIGIGCCGATWGFGPATIRVRHEDEEENGEQQQRLTQPQETSSDQAPNSSGLDCLGPTPAGSGMNLAAALAAERQFRGSQEPDGGTVGSGRNGRGGVFPGTPWRVSLMRLLEETEGGEGEVTTVTEKRGGEGNDSMCCVCMGRKKGAAFIPCGHTFCRVCSRELWLNRGTCPLCNRSIIEILDIF